MLFLLLEALNFIYTRLAGYFYLLSTKEFIIAQLQQIDVLFFISILVYGPVYVFLENMSLSFL